jgi:hypothetical protein
MTKMFLVKSAMKMKLLRIDKTFALITENPDDVSVLYHALPNSIDEFMCASGAKFNKSISVYGVEARHMFEKFCPNISMEDLTHVTKSS